MSLDGLSFSALVAELSAKLVGGRVEKIFQPDKYTLLLWIRQVHETHKLLISATPSHPHLFISSLPPENPSTPPSFCMLLRKHLEDGRVASVEQHDLDRIVTVDIDVRGEKGLIVTKRLIIELMGKHSNIIFVQDSIIVDAIKRVPFSISRYRQILPGKMYTLPPGQGRLNLLNTSPEIFIQTLFSSSQPLLLKALIATSMGMGPITGKEILWRAGLPDTIFLAALDENDKKELYSAFVSVIQPFLSNTLIPTVVVDTENRLMGIAAFPLEHLSNHSLTHTFATMSAAIEFSASLSPSIRHTPEQTILLKLISEEIARLSRKHTLLTQELTNALQAELYRQWGDILMTNLYAIPAEAASINLPDLYSENQDTMITIDLDSRLSPTENAQAYYAKYTKQKRAQESIKIQLLQCIDEQKYLESILIALEQAETNPEINEIRQELVAGGYIKEKGKRTSLPSATPIKITTPEGFTILIGKNNRQNDFVTFKQAQADDLWFHTKDIPGSHVILRTNGTAPPDSVLQTAAHFAAYFSKSRNSSNVPVDFTKRRYVKKPSGSKPGFVIYDRQQTVYITPNESLVKALINVNK